MNKSGSVSIRIYLSLAEEEDEDEDALLCIKEIRLLPVCTKILPSTVVGKKYQYIFNVLLKYVSLTTKTVYDQYAVRNLGVPYIGIITKVLNKRAYSLTLNLTRIFSIADLLDIGN